MSRHRFVKDLARKVNLDQDDEVLSDGGEDDMTPEQHLQLATAVTKVREVLGPESESGITDTEISDIVWNYYFDVETSIDMLLKEQARKAAAVAKKEDQLATSVASPSSVSALQRISLAHTQSATSKPRTSLAALVKGRVDSPATTVGTASTASSKLVALAARHAQSKSSTTSTPVSTFASPLPAAPLVPAPIPLAPTKPSKLAIRAVQATASGSTNSKATPLSKLAAKSQSLRMPSTPPTTITPPPTVEPAQDLLFTPIGPLAAAAPSVFGLLISRSQLPLASLAADDLVRPSSSFLFNVPSPDDIVMDARQGTSLANLVPRSRK
ncbi:hypothetical protein BKA62DRAFT_394510 [Auriculariales sp. MPI-PUGE-AT-0066]|nr:hypothetical protein BKA62DRAFT_394510 [Auriculariales sp. MPI-PUGE-AT-0066]